MCKETTLGQSSITQQQRQSHRGFYLHASIRSTLEFIRLTMLVPLDFSAGGVAGVPHCRLPFLVLLLFRPRLPLLGSKLAAVAQEASAMADEATRAGCEQLADPSTLDRTSLVWTMEATESPSTGGLSSALCVGLYTRGSSLTKEGRPDVSSG